MKRELLTSSIIRHVKDKPSLKPKKIIDEMKRDYGVTINYYYARGGFYPLAFAVVATTENDENWEWFLQNLKEVVSLQRPITFISDMHNSLLNFVPAVFPNSSHGYCFWHLKLNLRATIKGRSRNRKFIEGLFKECAYAYTIREFDEKYNDLMVGSKDNKQDVLDFLSRVPFEHWANAHFPGSRYGDMCSSIAESFNSWVGEERFLPITSMIDRIQNKLKERIDAGKTWQPPIKSREDLFEVHSISTNIVNLGRFSCTCGRWRVEGIPCVHALRCIIADGRPIQNFIDPMFSVLYYCQSYSHNIPPVDVDIGDLTAAHEEVVIPPEVRNQPGRPKTNRFPISGFVQQKGRFRSKICMTSAEWSEMTAKNLFDS
ncbi:Mudr family transposase [Thalictrum thalictroides]|uniref:Mudr family transposase n=1 Tax=Thalictrum thalictroides TaxID=46969 RepID=A0A7J6V3H4_THATH|nr:Mudr family transposase [Thalictrum thalictroides]